MRQFQEWHNAVGDILGENVLFLVASFGHIIAEIRSEHRAGNCYKQTVLVQTQNVFHELNNIMGRTIYDAQVKRAVNHLRCRPSAMRSLQF